MTNKVLLIAWPDLDWEILQRLVDRGALPASERLIERGVIGRLCAVAPVEPYPLWTAVATGRHAHAHGILGQQSLDPDRGEPVASHAAIRRAPALWEMTGVGGLRSVVVGWPATSASPADAAVVVSEAFGHPDIAKTRTTLESSISLPRVRARLADLWVRQEEMNDGVAQEFLRHWGGLEQISARDLGTVANALAFGFSRHAVLTHLLEHEPWEFAAVSWPATEWISRRLARNGPDASSSVAAGTSYCGAVEASYRLHDELLTNLLDIAGPDTTILVVGPGGQGRGLTAAARSALGLSGSRYRDRDGVLIGAGRAIERDALIHGATVLDIAPTVLQLLGLPVPRDLDGRIIAEAFAEPPAIERAPASPHAPGPEESSCRPALPVTSLQAVRARYAALGVIPREPATSAPPRDVFATRLLRWKLARSFCAGQRHLDALPVLEQLVEEEPENIAYTLQLANSQLQLGLLDEARDTLEMVLDERPDTALAHVCLARTEFSAGRHEQCLQHARDAVACAPPHPVLFSQLGLAYLHLRRWRDALDAFAASLDCAENAPAHIGRARALLGLRQFPAAAEAALDGIGQDYQNPLGHYLLGIALQRQGLLQQAAASLQVAANLAPAATRTHAQLIRLKRKLGAPESELATHRAALAAAQAKRPQIGDLQAAARKREELRRAERHERRRRATANVEIPAHDDREALNVAPMIHTLITGLPRAGISTIGRVLAAGGMPLLDDEGSATDIHWQALQRIWNDPARLYDAQSQLIMLPDIALGALPPIHHYRVVYVRRGIEETARSQAAVLTDSDVIELPHEECVRLLQQFRDTTIAALRAAPNVDLIEVSYDDLCARPQVFVEHLTDFFADQKLDATRMLAAIEPGRRHFKVVEQADPDAFAEPATSAC